MRVPASLLCLNEYRYDADIDGLLAVDICVSNGRIEGISRHDVEFIDVDKVKKRKKTRATVDAQGRICLPTFVDMHTHIDKVSPLD